MRFLLLLSFFFVASFAQQNPLKDPNICGRPTCKDGGKFKYKIGIEHSYKYTVDVKSLFDGTSKNESTLHIETVASIDITSNCDGILTLTDARLSNKPFLNEVVVDEDDIPEPEYLDFVDALSEFSIRFAFHDGIISEVCPEVGEKNWVMNFKKGLLSMLHNTMNRFDLDHEEEEEDVHGKCDATYRLLAPNETSLVIEKTKDLSLCETRSKLHSIVQSTPYSFKPKSAESNLLKSSSRCLMYIRNNIYKEISCEEKHVFQPFSNKDSGAATIVKQRLTLIDEISKKVDEQDPIERRTPLSYDPVPTPKPTYGELKTSRDLIKKLCKLNADDVQIEFSDLFTKFIHTARILSYSSLSVFYEKTSSLCPSAKKHVLDALPHLGSSASVRLMKNIIIRDGVPLRTTNEWMTSVALIPRPDIHMVEAMQQLLENKYHVATVPLGVSSLTHTFCMQNPDCISREAVETIVKHVEERTRSSYETSERDRVTQEALIISLKSLANIGIINEDFKDTLNRMIEDSTLHTSIRVEAIQVYRRYTCENSRNYFETIFRNVSEDTEIRIASYLQIMRCPDYLLLSTVRHALEVEEVNQVGSFIWTHLNNLLKSSIPTRVEIQSLLSEKDLVKKFSNDVRKFSNNYEGSVFFEEYNMGGNFEGNLIFSPSSYVPRSATFNLTVDLFGESINIFQIDGRFEGFEHYLESIFGPKGPLTGDKILNKLPKIRWPRAANEAETLQSEIDKYSHFIDNNNSDNPKLGFAIKVFGNDLKYVTFNGQEEIRDALSELNPIDFLKRILSGKEIKYNKATMFLDSSYVVPTGAGLPLTLNAIGTAAINLKLQGSLTSANFKKNLTLDMDAHLQPNVALDIVGSMSVDAYYLDTGIKVKSSLYTASTVEANVAVRSTKHIKVSFGMPKQSADIIGAKSELIVMKGGAEEKQSGIEKNRVSHSLCSWPVEVIGLKLCARYDFANVTKMENAPNFILAGPSAFKLGIQKIDPTAKTYLMEYRHNTVGDKTDISFIFETPGAVTQRVLSFNISHNDETGNLTLNLDSLKNNFLAKGEYKNTDAEKYLQLAFDVNSERKFGALLSLQKTPIHHGFNYSPKLILDVNNERKAGIKGIIKSVEKQGVAQTDVNLNFQTKKLESHLFGYITKKETTFGVNLILDYTFVNTSTERVNFLFEGSNKSKQRLIIYVANAVFNNTQYPDVNFNSTFKSMNGERHMDLKFGMEFGESVFKGEESRANTSYFQAAVAHKFNKNLTIFEASTSLTKEATNLDLGLNFTWTVTHGCIYDGKLSTRYAEGKDIIIRTHWWNPKQPYKHLQGRLNITVPSYKPMILEGHLKEQENSYDIGLKGVWFTGFNMELGGTYYDKSTVSQSDHHFKMMKLKSSSFDEIIIDLHFYVDNDKLKVNLEANQSKDNYQLYFEHFSKSAIDMQTQGKIKYKTKVYWFANSISSKADRQIKLELHIDQLRDIHLEMWGHNKESHKDLGLEIKWDANRDPNQKLAVTIYIANPGPYDYRGNLDVSYPGRSIRGEYKFLWEAGDFLTLARLAWSPEDAFQVQVGVNYKSGEESYVMFKSELLTPFEDLRRTSLSAGYHHMDNMYRVNGSIHWQHDQRVYVDLYGDYSGLATPFLCELRLALASTVHDIPSFSLSIKHSHNATQIDTIVHVMHDPSQMIDLNSSWKIDEDQRMKNLTGTVTIRTPYKGFNKGLLVSKIYVTNSRNLKGVADLDIDHRKFTATVEGDFQKLTKSMLSFNVTTPFQKYNKLSGHFGFMEDNRHLVAMIRHPTGNSGIEIKLLILALNDFDIIFNLATPIEVLQEILVVGKLQENEADFRLKWKPIGLVGFTGVWRYEDVMNFEHSYKLFTPIEGLEENGVVAKLIYREGLDSELSIKLAETRLGVIVRGKPKSKFLKELGIETQQIYNEKLANGDEPGQVNIGREDPLSWEGFVEIDTLLYPTMQGYIDIEQKGTVYDLLASLTLPNGKAELRNEFDYRGRYNIENQFYLSTPYKTFKSIFAGFSINLVPQSKYLVDLSFDYQNDTSWIKTGAKVHYISSTGSENVYNLTVHLHTPSNDIPLVDFSGALRADSKRYRTEFRVTTKRTDAFFDGDLQIHGKESLESDVDFHINSPLFNVPQVKLHFFKDFADAEKKIRLDFDTPRSRSNKVNFATVWRYASIKDFKVNLQLDAPLRRLSKCNASAEVNMTGRDKLLRADVYSSPLFLNVYGSIREDQVNGSFIVRSSEGMTHNIDLNCTLKPTSQTELNVDGILTFDGAAHDLQGTAEVREDTLRSVALQMSAKGKKVGSFFLRINPLTDGYNLSSTLNYGNDYAKFDARTFVKDKLEWSVDVKADTSHSMYKYLGVHARATTHGSNTTLLLSAETPFDDIESPRFGISTDMGAVHHNVNGFYELKDSGGSAEGSWSWMLLEDMSVNLRGNFRKDNSSKKASFNAFYANPRKAFELLKVGVDVNLNSTWGAGSNLTLSLPGPNKVDVKVNVKLSPATNEVHSLHGKLYIFDNSTALDYLGKYKKIGSNINYGIDGSLKYGDLNHLSGDLNLEWGKFFVQNHAAVDTVKNVTDILYTLGTSHYKEGKTIATYLKYTRFLPYHNVSCKVFNPGSRLVGRADVDFKEFGNMNGTVNVTTPFKGFDHIGVHFVTLTTSSEINRFTEVFWVNNTALLDSKCKITRGRNLGESQTKGVINIEVPLATRHVARVDYGYQVNDQVTVGNGTVEYNKEKILVGKYNSKSESRTGFNKDNIHWELKNDHYPIGADYVHEYKYNGDGDGANIPTVDTKWANVYNLYNRTALNITGEFVVETTGTGREISLTAIHSNRTVKFRTNYDMLDQQFKQHSHLELDPKVWLAYDIDLLNKTDALCEAQQIQINLSYPKRNFTAAASYNYTGWLLASDVGLHYDKDNNKTVQGGFEWKIDESDPQHHEVRLDVKHPSFEKNVTVFGEYQAKDATMADIALVIDYSTNPDKLVKLKAAAANHSKNNVIKYTYTVTGAHPATKLFLDMKGGIVWRHKYFISEHYANYTRTFDPQETDAICLLDFEKDEVKLRRKTPSDLTSFWGKYEGSFPLYTANMTAVYGSDIDANGEYYLNFYEKLLRFDLNKTKDGSQSLHMYGVIPDARNAIFDIWRDYEEIRVFDVSYLLRLNHSRLFISNLKWRPQLRDEMRKAVHSFLYEGYNRFTEEVNNTRQYVRNELIAAIEEVWSDATPHIQTFLDDFKGLNVISEDLRELKKFVNSSYYANEFYIRDVVNLILHTVDELSLRTHIESVPAIVNEMWQVMGDSGKKIHQSIVWVIEKIKTYYQKATDFLNDILQGKAVDHLSDTFKVFVEKYDNFIKDMHVSIIKYAEDLWSKSYKMLVENWRRALISVEPTFIKIIHYVEHIVWSAGREFVDFLYTRKAEILESEYFNKFAKLTQDLDRFYKDITGDDTLGAIHKYSKVAFDFLKKKYFELVPFAKELERIYTEIVDEVTQLKNLPLAQFMMQRFDQVYEKVKWFADYFDVQTKIHRFVTLVRLKLMDMKRNALETENRHREAKTKFIFEPSQGVMYLEQKLPMSWHAFNETPKFDEIPEFKKLKDVQRFFSSSKLTFASIYTDYKPFIEVTQWLPPFKAQAILVRGKHFITFDRTVYDFRGDCTYLLASDFRDGNFSIAVSYNKHQTGSHRLLILLNKTLVQIDLQTKVINVAGKDYIALPYKIGESHIHLESDIVTVASEYGFKVQCNMKFDVCMFEVSGWYFGKTGGLWGTMNNEPSDDFLTPEKQRLGYVEVAQFANSWSLDRSCSTTDRRPVAKNTTESVRILCESFFAGKVSPFITCFPRVSPKSFLDICLESSDEEEVCSVAIAYISLCADESTPLRIPDNCVKCKLENGTTIPEGKFITMKDHEIPRTTDVVFIVEGKNCNSDLKALKKKVEAIVEHLEKELLRLNITRNRYAIVEYGNPPDGNGRAHSVLINNTAFAEHQLISSFLDHIKTSGDDQTGNSDVFHAIELAAEMAFRPGVAKTFILLPCADCRQSRRLDYSILHQLLDENGIALHILMNEEIRFKKATRANKIVFGFDRIRAFTKSDADDFKGDRKLKKDIHLPKNTLGSCLPLAQESNGAVFTGKKLEGKLAPKAAKVFARRLAESAQSQMRCKTCECTGHNTGVSYLECLPCEVPSPFDTWNSREIVAEFDYEDD
nr:uncharacterized protein LOC111413892 [Onthophagus taurus]